MLLWTEHTALCAIRDGNVPEGAEVGCEHFRTTDYIGIGGRELLRLRMPCAPETDPVSYGVCFYDAGKNLLPDCGVIMDHGSGSFAVDTDLYVPEGAAYFRTSYWEEDVISARCPELPFRYSFENWSEADRPFTHALPTCTEMNNVIKRARQLTDIRWTPGLDVPRYCMTAGEYSGQHGEHFLDWCRAGREYVGIPYSGSGEPDRNTKAVNPETFCGRWGYYKFHVGIDISFETFVTACRYPDSIFGERAGQTEPDFDSSPYGTYCSALVGYALGYRQPLPKVVEFCDSGNFLRIAERIPSLDPERLRLCDVLLYGAYHIALITDVLRGADGKVCAVEVSEATTVGNNDSKTLYSGRGGLCRRKLWPVAELYGWFRNYALFRIRSFHGISYEKSDFVDVGNEKGSRPAADLPLIPYLGNGARYRKDHILDDRILIGAPGWAEFVIEKDGRPFRTVALTGERSVPGGFSTVGSYRAFLRGGGQESVSCRWTVEE